MELRTTYFESEAEGPISFSVGEYIIAKQKVWRIGVHDENGGTNLYTLEEFEALMEAAECAYDEAKTVM